MNGSDTKPGVSPWWLALDAAGVSVFVLVGRDTHDEGSAFLATLFTLAPLLLGLAVAWAIVRAPRSPLTLRTGLGTALVGATTGLLLRRLVFGDGTAAPFVLVTFGFYVAVFLGWRTAVSVAHRTRARGATVGRVRP